MSTSPDMLFEFGGAPVGGKRFSNPFATHWFVDGVDGHDNNSGKNPDKAKATIDAAAQLMGVGDVCYIRPQTYVVGTGHARYTESVTIDLAQSDMSFIGTGYSRSNEFGVRMKATSTEVECIDVSAPSCHFENIGLFGDGTATNTLLARNNGGTNTQRGSDGITLYRINSKGAPLKITGGQAARVIDCVFNNAAYELILADPAASGYNQQVRGCAFLDTGGGTAVTHPHVSAPGSNIYDVWIDGCYFGKIPTTTAYYFECGAAQSTGMITGSYFNTTNLDTDTDISIAASNIMLVGCYDKTGLVDATND